MLYNSDLWFNSLLNFLQLDRSGSHLFSGQKPQSSLGGNMGFRSLLQIPFSFLLIGVLSFATLADTIRLKDGSIIKGTITAFGSGSFTVTVGEGQRRRELVFSAAEVESIEFDTASVRRERPMTQIPVSDREPVKTPPQVIVSDNTTSPVSSQPQSSSQRTSTGSSTWERLPDKPVAKVQPKIPSAKPPVTTRKSEQPIEVGVRVLADNTNNGWTNSGWVVKKGQKIRITGTGEIDLGAGKKCSPDGIYDLEDESKLLKAVPTGALIAVIGDDNNDFIYVGKTREIVAARDGALFLGVNEGELKDNKGSFDVKVEIDPDTK